MKAGSDAHTRGAGAKPELAFKSFSIRATIV